MYFQLSQNSFSLQSNIQAGNFYTRHVFFLAYHILKHRRHNFSHAPGSKHHRHIYLFGVFVSIFSAVRTIAGAV